jgi:hypothetical protein
MKKLRILVIDDNPVSIAKAIEQFSDKYELTTTSYEKAVREISKFNKDNKTTLFDVVFTENSFLPKEGSYISDPSLIKHFCHLDFVIDVINKGTSAVVVVNSWNQGFDAFIYFTKGAFGKNFNPRDFGTIQSDKTEFFFRDYKCTDQNRRWKDDTKNWEYVIEQLSWLIN